MSRIRLNQELRNKGGLRFRLHLEQEQTQEKEDFFQKRENFKAIQDKTWLGVFPRESNKTQGFNFWLYVIKQLTNNDQN